MQNKRARQLALLRRGCGSGISSCFLQSNLRISPTYALQKSSVTAKTVGVYCFLTLFQIPPLLLSLKTNVKSISPLNLKSQKRFCINKRFFVKRKGRSKSKQARLQSGLLQRASCPDVVAGVGFEPHDLRVMSPTSYQAAPSRDFIALCFA